MAPRKPKSSRRRGASRSRSSGSSPFAWFVAGLLVGLGIAGFAMFKGMVPKFQSGTAQQESSLGPASEPALIEPSRNEAEEARGSKFDFFTVLPEMEVVVPEQELARRNRENPQSATEENAGNYILQAGSFRNMSDADQMKARLALLGAQANIEVVTVNDVQWHRVRIGPVRGARQADDLHQMLRDNGIETLILRDSS